MAGPERDDWIKVDPPRLLNSWEVAVISRIVAACGYTAFDSQIGAARVWEACPHCLSVMLEVDHTVEPALEDDGTLVGGVLPFELAGKDRDGMMIWALLDTAEGYMFFLDAQRADGEPVQQLPDVSRMNLKKI